MNALVIWRTFNVVSHVSFYSKADENKIVNQKTVLIFSHLNTFIYKYQIISDILQNYFKKAKFPEICVWFTLTI